MRSLRGIIIATTLLLSSAVSGAQDLEVLQRHVEELSSYALEGRKAGTEDEKDAAVYVTEELRAAGVDILSGKEGDIFGLKGPEGDTLTSRNVIGFIEGYDKNLKDRYIVIGARLDHMGSYTGNINGEAFTRVYNGANGNASGLAMLIELGRILSTNSVLLRRSVLLVAFGSSLISDAGAWYFLNRSFADAGRIDAMINLETLGTGSEGFYAYTASNNDLNALIASQRNTVLPVYPKVVSSEPFASCHRSFYGKEIPAVMFTTGDFPERNTSADTPDIVDYEYLELEQEYIYDFAVALANADKAPSFRKEDAPEAKASKNCVPYTDCDYKPSFLGSTDPVNFLKNWVYVYLRYPEGAVRDGVQGRVLVDFVIDEKGNVCDVEVARGVDQRLDDEAVRVISASPAWKPGRLRGQKVRTKLSIYVEFKLERR